MENSTFDNSSRINFLGRLSELETIERAMANPAIQFIIVYGLGGVGKTALGQAVIKMPSIVDKFEGRIVWIDCSRDATLDNIMVRIASTLNIPGANQTTKSLRNIVIDLISKTPILLVLDSYENVAKSEYIFSFLGRLPKQNKVIILTRARVHTPGREILVRLEGFTENETKAYLQQVLGPTMFNRLSPDELNDIHTFSGGLPLAVALIAEQLKRTGTFSRIELQDESYDVVDRIFERLYPLLDNRQKKIINALSIYANPVDWKGIVSVANIENWEPSDEKRLGQLSFVEQVGEKFALHPVVRSILRQTISNNDLKEYHAMQHRMVNYYLLFCDQNKDNFSKIDQEWANIRFSIEVASDNEFWNEFLGIVSLLVPYASSRALGLDYETWISRAIDLSSRLDDQRVIASFMNNLGVWYQSRGEISKAQRAYEESLIREKQIGDRLGESRSLSQSALLDLQQENYLRAEEKFRNALKISEELGDNNGKLTILGNLGILFLRLHDYIKADELLRQALEISKKTNDRNAEAKLLTNLGSVSLEIRRYAEAERYFQQSLEISRELGDLQIEINVLRNLASTYRYIRRFVDAETCLRQALMISRDIAHVSTETHLLSQLSLVVRDMGRYEEAEMYLKQALNLSRTIKEKITEMTVLSDLGSLTREMGRNTESEEYLNEAIKLSRELGYKNIEAKSLANLGLVSSLPNSERVDYLQKAVELYQKALMPNSVDPGSVMEYAGTLNNLAITLDNLNRTEEAIEYLSKALNYYNFDSYPIQRAMTLNNLGMVYLHTSHGDRTENLKSAIGYFENALKIYTANVFPREWLRVSVSLCNAYGKIRDWNNARKQIVAVIDTLHSAIGDQQAIDALAPSYVSLGDISKKYKDYELSTRIFLDIAHRYEVHGDNVPRKIKNRLAKLRELIGDDEFVVIWGEVQGAITPKLASTLREAMHSIESGEYLLAVDGFSQALITLSEVEDSQILIRQKASVYFHRGFCFRKLERWEDALKDLKIAFDNFEGLKEFGGEARVLLEMGNIYSVMNNYEEARLCFMDAYRLYRRITDNMGMALASEALGRLEYSLRMIPQAIADLEEARQLYIFIGERGVAESLIGLVEDAKTSLANKRFEPQQRRSE